MTTTLVPGTLTVTITEALQLDNADPGGPFDHGVDLTNAFSIASVNKLVRRVASIPTTETGLVSFATNEQTAVAATAFASGYVAGHLDKDAVRYLRITNKDADNEVILVFRSGAKEFALVLEFGQSFLLSAHDVTGLVAHFDANTTGVTPTLTDLDDITALAVTADVDIEVFAAMI